jgi:hypothetical protein
MRDDQSDESGYARYRVVPTGRELATDASVDRLTAGLLVVPTRAEQYRLTAKECAERAKLARDPETKRVYEDMARQWLELAKRAEEGGGS